MIVNGTPERVVAAAFIGPAFSLTAENPGRTIYPFDEPLETTDGWAKFNAHYWLRDDRDFLEFFFGQVFSEPHSTKQIEDGIGWGLNISPETLIATRGMDGAGQAEWLELCARVRCPTLVIHGDEDRVRPHAHGAALARATGGRLVTLAGSGHEETDQPDPVRLRQHNPAGYSPFALG